MGHDHSLWPTEPDDTSSRPNWRDIIEDIVAADLNAVEQWIRDTQDRLGSNTYGGGVAGSDFFAYQHPSGGLRLRVNPGNLYTGASDPVWVAQQDSSTLTGPVTNPRIDVLVIDNAAGTVSWVAGSESATPAIPAIPGTKTPLWAVYLRVGATTIDRQGYNTGTNSYLYRDMRPGMGARPIGGPLQLTGIAGPVNVTADQNNYSPTGFATSSTILLNPTAARNITGFAAPANPGEVKLVFNVSASNNLTLKDASASSSAANRFAFPSGDIVLLPLQGIWLAYETDGTNLRWRTSQAPIPTSLPPSGSAGGDLGGTYPNPTVLQASGAFAFPGDISPSQITANQNDYAPTGHATAGVFRLNSDASRNITSLAGGADGRLVFLVNVGSFNIVLKDDDGATGTAANRFALTADITMTPDTLVVLLYDSTTLRWRAVAGGGGGGAGGTPALVFGTANTPGAASTFIRTDDAIAVFDATAPVTQAFSDSAAAGSAAFAARRDHKHGMPAGGGAGPLAFLDSNLAASLTSVAMAIPSDANLKEIVMPWAGSIIGVSVACENARTAGTATFKPTVNGTESSTLSAVLDGTNTQYHYGSQAAGTDTFTAGQRVGVKVTTTGTWAAGTTPSVVVEVFVLPAVSPPAGLSTASAQLGSDVTMTNANQFYDGPSVSLAAGTWLVMAGVVILTNGSFTTDFTAKIWDGTTATVSSQDRFAAGVAGSLSLAGYVSPGSTTTYKISVAGNNGGNTMKAAAPVNGAGNNASWILALRVA